MREEMTGTLWVTSRIDGYDRYFGMRSSGCRRRFGFDRAALAPAIVSLCVPMPTYLLNFFMTCPPR